MKFKRRVPITALERGNPEAVTNDHTELVPCDGQPHGTPRPAGTSHSLSSAQIFIIIRARGNFLAFCTAQVRQLPKRLDAGKVWACIWQAGSGSWVLGAGVIAVA